jgi:flavin reductase (DIM6/NTAB) family NADH-FMN oxidoreductase RutF
MLCKDHKDIAFTCFKPAKAEGGKLSGQAFHAGTNGTPILDNAVAAVECSVLRIVELGDHHIFVGEVTEAAVRPRDGPMQDSGDEGPRRERLSRWLDQ